MDHICVVFPLLPGKTEEARAFQRELDTARKAEYDQSERRIGITKEWGYRGVDLRQGARHEHGE